MRNSVVFLLWIATLGAILTEAMPAKPAHCFCTVCKGDVVQGKTAKKHAWQMEIGTRQAYIPAPAAAAPAAEPPAAEDPVPIEELAPENEDSLFQKSKNFAFQVAELVAQGLINITGADAVLKLVSRTVQPWLPEEMQLPRSWYLCRKLALDGKEPKYITRDFCPECDYLYDDNSTQRVCPDCPKAVHRYDDKGQAVRQAYYFDIDDKVTRMFAAEFTASQLNNGAASDVHDDRPLGQREITGCWDGTLLQTLCGLLAPFVAVKNCIFFAQSNDGVEVTKSTTFTPITAKVLNYGGKMRGLLTNIVLLGFMPPNVKNYQNMLLPVVEMYAKRAPSTGEPLQVHAHAHPTRTHIT